MNRIAQELIDRQKECVKLRSEVAVLRKVVEAVRTHIKEWPGHSSTKALQSRLAELEKAK